jgi:hypothetical protein
VVIHLATGSLLLHRRVAMACLAIYVNEVSANVLVQRYGVRQVLIDATEKASGRVGMRCSVQLP